MLMLSAGIESLPELDSASPYSNEDIQALAEGAACAAKEAKIDVEIARLQGLLGMLRKQNLARRLKLLGNTIRPLLSHDHAAVISSVRAIRNATAHGNAGVEALIPKLSPTTHALAAMCVIWDQETSGLPVAALKRQFNPQIIASEALGRLTQKERR